MATEIFLHDYQDEWGYEYVIGMGDLSGAAISQKIEAASGQDVLLRINSMGGSVWDAVQIVAAIKKHGKVNAQIDGIAFSAAAVISAACNEVSSTKYALFMIHNSRVYADMWGAFTASELRKLAEESSAQMDACDKVITQVFVEKTKLPEAQIIQMLEDETWLTATEAKELGFIDSLTDETAQAIAKSIYNNAFAKAPMRIVAMAGKNIKTKENNKDMSTIAEEIKAQNAETKSMFAEIKAFFTGKAPVAQAEPEPEKVEEQATEGVAEPTADELKAENERLKGELATANQKNEAADAALIEAKALTAETKQLLTDVKSTYKPTAEAKDFGKVTDTPKSEGRFSHLTK